MPEGNEFELKLQIGTSVMTRWFSKDGLSDLWFTGTLPKRLTLRQNSYIFSPYLENERHFLTSRRFSRSSPQSSSTFLCSCSPSIKKIDDEIFSMTGHSVTSNTFWQGGKKSNKKKLCRLLTPPFPNISVSNFEQILQHVKILLARKNINFCSFFQFAKKIVARQKKTNCDAEKNLFISF